MASDQEIKTALARARKAIELRPSLAKGTVTTHLRLEEGLKCTARFEQWDFPLDEPASVGGDGTAPIPGAYAMSGLAGCVAMSIKVAAIQAGVKVGAVEVEVNGDYDDRGSPGFERFRLKINVESNASEAVIRALADQAFERSTWFNTFTKPQEVTAELSVTTTVDDA